MGNSRKLVYILAPFENLTKKCGRRNETCAIIIPSVLALKVLLQKASSSDKYAGIMTMIYELIKSVICKLLIPILPPRPAKFNFIVTLLLNIFLKIFLVEEPQSFPLVVPRYVFVPFFA